MIGLMAVTGDGVGEVVRTVFGAVGVAVYPLVRCGEPLLADAVQGGAHGRHFRRVGQDDEGVLTRGQQLAAQDAAVQGK